MFLMSSPLNAQEFVCKIRSSGGDYTNLVIWEAAVESDLTAANSQIFTVSDMGTYDPAVDDGANVTFTGAGTGLLKHINTDSNAYVISVTGTVNTGPVVISGSGNTFTIATPGQSIQRAVAECYNDWPNGLVQGLVIDGWVTDADHYVKIFAPKGERHNGWTWTDASKTVFSGFALRSPDSNWANAIADKEGATRIEGIIFAGRTRDGNSALVGWSESGSTLFTYISHCIIFDFKSNAGIRVNNSGGTGIIGRNLIIYDCKYGASIDYFWRSISLLNSTIVDCETGLRGGSTDTSLQLRNVLLKNTIDITMNAPNLTGMSIQYTASSDDTSGAWGGEGNRTNRVFAFKDEVNDNFHLSREDKGAKDLGTNVVSYAGVTVLDDIDYETRKSAWAWDIGADEVMPVRGTIVVVK